MVWAGAQETFEQLDPSGYRIGYQAITRLFQDYVRPDDYQTVAAGAYAVYGWMPTIMKRGVQYAAWSSSKEALGKLSSAADWPEANKILSERPSILTLINGSLVGTSKFLHFLNPEVLPIWDSRIGRVFRADRRDLVEKRDKYLAYCSAVSEAIQHEIIYPAGYVEFSGDDVSPVRRLEFLLFLYGQSDNFKASSTLGAQSLNLGETSTETELV